MDSYEIFTVALDRPNQTIPYHTTPYQTKPHQTKPTVQPLSKLVQDSIQHLIPKLENKARDTKHIHQIIMQLNRQWQQLGGLPDTARQIAADVWRLYPSVDNDMGIPAMEKLLQRNMH